LYLMDYTPWLLPSANGSQKATASTIHSHIQLIPFHKVPKLPMEVRRGFEDIKTKPGNRCGG
jgi:hypothetical protein